jgi:hypothetical protein
MENGPFNFYCTMISSCISQLEHVLALTLWPPLDSCLNPKLPAAGVRARAASAGASSEPINHHDISHTGEAFPMGVVATQAFPVIAFNKNKPGPSQVM